MKFIIGKKIGMTQVFSSSGEVVPVTRVKAGPCVIVQVKTKGKDNAQGVEIGFEEIKEYKINKPKAGHLKDLKSLRHLISFNTESTDNIARGDEITVETFGVGDKITVQGVSKGKGFAGVVKRHHFRGGPGSHGGKHDLRAPGSIGAGGVQRVFKGMRMAGRMGGAPVTVKNLEIIEINPENNELLIKGAVPGARNGILKIIGQGDLIIKKDNPIVVEAQADSIVPANENKAPEAVDETLVEKTVNDDMADVPEIVATEEKN
jgi:large subunit ribosomal protein L3